jgi:hypothetical protein
VRDLPPKVVLAFRTQHSVLGGLEHHGRISISPSQTPDHTATAPGPLTALEIAKQFPTLGISLGGPRPHVRRKIREYLSLPAATQLPLRAAPDRLGPYGGTDPTSRWPSERTFRDPRWASF